MKTVGTKINRGEENDALQHEERRERDGGARRKGKKARREMVVLSSGHC